MGRGLTPRPGSSPAWQPRPSSRLTLSTTCPSVLGVAGGSWGSGLVALGGLGGGSGLPRASGAGHRASSAGSSGGSGEVVVGEPSAEAGGLGVSLGGARSRSRGHIPAGAAGGRGWLWDLHLLLLFLWLRHLREAHRMRPRLPRLAAPRAGHAKQRGWARLPAGAPVQAWLLAHHERSLIPTSQPLGTAWSQEVQRGPAPDVRG